MFESNMILKVASAGAVLAAALAQTQKPYCTDPITTTASPTTESSGCVTNFSDQIVQPDFSIRLLNNQKPDWCLFKKYSGYNVGDEVWWKSCDVDNANQNKAAKYKWSYDPATGLVSSKGAKDLFGTDLCWRITSLTRFGKQRVLLANCNESDDRQQ